MDADSIIKALDTLTAADLKRVYLVAAELYERHQGWEQQRPQQPGQTDNRTYQQEYRKCNKPTCKRCATGGQGHGPYWVAYWREAGVLKRQYLGRNKPS